MKNFLLLTALFSNFAFADNSDKPDKIIDAQLNASYKNIMQQSNEDPYLQSALKISQRNWLKYRDSECEILTGTFLRVQTQNMYFRYIKCIDKMNSDRTDFLNSIKNLTYDD